MGKTAPVSADLPGKNHAFCPASKEPQALGPTELPGDA